MNFGIRNWILKLCFQNNIDPVRLRVHDAIKKSIIFV